MTHDPALTEVLRGRVPKDFSENVKYRRSLLLRCRDDMRFRKSVVQMCADDILFWVNSFVWLYEPRPPRKDEGRRVGLTGEIPFITWPVQDEIFTTLEDCVGREDLCIVKCRDIGASWMVVTNYKHKYLFNRMLSFTLMSRKEDLVDRKGDPDSLFWKFDFITSHLPGWMRPPVDKNKMHRLNLRTESVVNGESTTAESSVGGRRTSLMLDEFALVKDSYAIKRGTADVTNSRIFVSTPAGIGNAFYEVAHDGECRVLTIPWWKIPTKSVGLYTSGKMGRLQILDKSYPFPNDYQFITDGKKRSPWFDDQCKRRSVSEVASQLECDFLGSDSPYFPPDLLQRIMDNDCRAPDMEGRLERGLDCDPIAFVHGRRGGLRLWLKMGADGNPPKDWRYCIACDIGTGSGATPSVASIGIAETGEKVGELAVADLRPDQFAEYVVAMCRWFKGKDPNGAYLCWEDNGPGNSFGQRIVDLGYGNVYYRSEDERTRLRLSKKAGWWTGPKDSHCSKSVLAGEYLRRLNTGEFINRSRISIEEAQQYMYAKDGGVGHGRSMVDNDPSGARDNHSDRVMADMLLNRIMPERHQAAPPPEPEYPPHSMGWNLEQRGKLAKLGRRRKYEWRT